MVRRDDAAGRGLPGMAEHNRAAENRLCQVIPEPRAGAQVLQQPLGLGVHGEFLDVIGHGRGEIARAACPVEPGFGLRVRPMRRRLEFGQSIAQNSRNPSPDRRVPALARPLAHSSSRG